MAKQASGVVWHRAPSVMGMGLARLGDQAPAAIKAKWDGRAIIIRNRMKAEHPWQNQTGEAEDKLDAKVTVEGYRIRLVAYQGAPHGIFLEKRYQGRWGIIPKVMESEYGNIMDDVRDATGTK